MATAFQPGDLVKLKSGGPQMTVDSWDDKRKAYRCVWFESNTMRRGSFSEAVLQKMIGGAWVPIVLSDAEMWEVPGGERNRKRNEERRIEDVADVLGGVFGTRIVEYLDVLSEWAEEKDGLQESPRTRTFVDKRGDRYRLEQGMRVPAGIYPEQPRSDGLEELIDRSDRILRGKEPMRPEAVADITHNLSRIPDAALSELHREVGRYTPLGLKQAFS
jgi:uncharacterized protein YodC (DUF2158 family)